MNRIEMSNIKARIIKKIPEIGMILNKYGDQNNLSLMGGNSGVSLFLFYYSHYYENDESYNYAIKYIENSFELVQNGSSYQAFAGGLAGLCWVIEHLSQNDFLKVDTMEVIGEIDDFLYQYMIREIKNGNYDYLHGACGIALYFLNRKSNPQSTIYLNEFVDFLDEIKGVEGKFLKWKSEIGNNEHELIEVYNLSLSHGVSSIIAILSKIYLRNVNKKKTEHLLRGAIDYLLTNQFESNEISCFPGTISLNGSKGSSSRLSWCYGDLGIAVSLWNASQTINYKKLEKKSIEILLHASKRRDLIANMVVDAGLCHGTAGIAHIFNRMFINTRIKEFKEASEYWFNETLKMAKFDDGLAGFKVYRTEEHGGWTNDYGLLEGIAGIGLAMISFVSDIEPAWDECLLLS